MTNILKYIIFGLATIIILSTLLSGCDKIKCYPDFAPDGSYIGFKCGGNW